MLKTFDYSCFVCLKKSKEIRNPIKMTRCCGHLSITWNNAWYWMLKIDWHSFIHCLTWLKIWEFITNILIFIINNYCFDLEDCVLFWINCDNCINVSGLIICACIPRLNISVHSSRSPFIHFLCVYLVKLSGFGWWTWFL